MAYIHISQDPPEQTAINFDRTVNGPLQDLCMLQEPARASESKIPTCSDYGESPEF